MIESKVPHVSGLQVHFDGLMGTATAFNKSVGFILGEKVFLHCRTSNNRELCFGLQAGNCTGKCGFHHFV
jgi:hypothetical protein